MSSETPKERQWFKQGWSQDHRFTVKGVRMAAPSISHFWFSNKSHFLFKWNRLKCWFSGCYQRKFLARGKPVLAKCDFFPACLINRWFSSPFSYDDIFLCFIHINLYCFNEMLSFSTTNNIRSLISFWPFSSSFDHLPHFQTLWFYSRGGGGGEGIRDSMHACSGVLRGDGEI